MCYYVSLNMPTNTQELRGAQFQPSAVNALFCVLAWHWAAATRLR